MAEGLMNKNELMAQWMNDGTVDNLFNAYKEYANSDEFNTYRGTSLLESARKHKDELGMTDEEITENPILTQTFMTMAKMAEYAGKGADKAVSNRDADMARNVIARQKQTTSRLGSLINYKENRSEFENTFAQLTSMEGGKSNTFGETTSYDDIKHDVGLGTELWNSFTDTSVISNIMELMQSQASKEETATKKEMLRTTSNTGTLGTAASLLGSVGAFMLESATFGKLGSMYSKSTSTAMKVSSGLRYLTQGFLLPQMQNWNEQSGLTQKYNPFGESEIETHFLNNVMDGIHNVAGMYVGDKLLTPVIERMFNTSILRKVATDKGLKGALKNYQGEVGDIGIDDAVANLTLKLKKIPGLQKEYSRIINRMKGFGSEVKDSDISNAMRDGLKIFTRKELITSGVKYAGADLLADYAFDMISHNAVNVASKLVGLGSAFTVHQDRMFDVQQMFKDGAAGFGEGMLNSLIQRAGMRAFSKAGNLLKIKITGEDADLKDTSSLAGSKAYYKELGIDVDNPVNKLFIGFNAMFGEDFLKQIDVEMQRTTGRRMIDVATSGDAHDDIFAMVNSWYVRKFSGQKGVLATMQKIDEMKGGKFDIDAALRKITIDQATGMKTPVANIITNIVKETPLRVKNLGKKVDVIADYIMADFSSDMENLKKDFVFRGVDKLETEDITKATSVEGRVGEDATTSIDDRIFKKLIGVIAVLNKNGDVENDLVPKLQIALKKRMQDRIKGIYDSVASDQQKARYNVQNISTLDHLAKKISNTDGLQVNLTEKDLTTIKDDLIKNVFVSDEDRNDILTGGLSKEEKRDAISYAKGLLMHQEDVFKVSIDEMTQMDASMMLKQLVGLSKGIMESDLRDIDKSAETYDAINDFVESKAKELLKEYQTNIENAANANNNLTDDGRQRKVFANAYQAITLATNVGYNWKSELEAFEQKLLQPHISSILNNAVKNKTIYNVGSMSAIKEGIVDAEDPTKAMIAEMYNKMHNVQQAKHVVFSQMQSRMNIQDQVSLMTGSGLLSRDITSNQRSMNPMFYWDETNDRVEFRVDGVGMDKSILMGTDDKINIKYTNMMMNLNKLNILEYDRIDISQLIGAALIKNLDINEKESGVIKSEMFESDGVSAKAEYDRTQGKYVVDIDLSNFREDHQSHLFGVYDYVDKAFVKKRDSRAFIQGDRSPRTQFYINGNPTTTDEFVKKLEKKSMIDTFSLTHAGMDILSRADSREDAVNKMIELVGFLDPTLIAEGKDKNGDPKRSKNLEEITIMMDQFMSERAGKYALDYKFKIVVGRHNGAIRAMAKDMELTVADTGNIGEFAKGDLKVMNIDFDDEIDFKDKKVLNLLRKMNIMPLPINFGVDLAPVWIQNKTLGALNATSADEFRYMRATLKNVIEERIVRRPSNNIIRTEEQLRSSKPTSMEEAILKAHYEKAKSGTAEDYMKHILKSAGKYEQERLENYSTRYQNKLIHDKGKGDDVVGPKGAIAHMKRIISMASKGDFLENTNDYVKLILTNVSNVARNMPMDINNMTDADLTNLKNVMARSNQDLYNTFRNLEDKFTDETIKFNLSIWMDEDVKNAYDVSDLDTYRGLDGFKGGLDDAINASEKFNDVVNNRSLKDDDLRGYFYTLLMFNEAAVSAKNLEKRISYMYVQNNMMKGGNLPPEMKDTMDKYLLNMAKNGGKIYLTNSRGDGMGYLHKDLYNIYQNTVGSTGGKMTSNSAFGGKFMFRRNHEITKTGQQIHVVGKAEPQAINKYDILLDLNSLKTLYPELLERVNLGDGTNKKGNALEINMTLDKFDSSMNVEARQFLAGISLHTALKANAKDTDPSRSSGNLSSPYEDALNRIGVRKSSSMAKEFIDSASKQLDNMWYDPRRFEGTIRSLFNRNYGTGATAVAEKWNDLLLDPSQKANDVQFYSDDAPIVASPAGTRMNPGPETTIGSKMLAEIGRKYLSDTQLKDNGTRKRLKALVGLLADVNHDNWNKIISDFRKSSGIRSLAMEVSEKDYDTFVKAGNGTEKNFSSEADGKGMHKTVLSTQQAFDKAVWSMMYILSGKDGVTGTRETIYDKSGKAIGTRQKERQQPGFIAAFDIDTLGKHTNGDNKHLFAMNVTRFPNHNLGQNTMAFIKGITIDNEGVSIKDTWYTKIFGGDWDGDTLQVTAVDSEDLRTVKINDKSVFGENDYAVVESLVKWHYKAFKANRLQSEATLYGDPKDMGVGESPGDAIAATAKAQHTAGYIKLDKTGFNALSSKAFYDMKGLSRTIETEGENIRRKEFSVYFKDNVEQMDYHDDLSIFDPLVKGNNDGTASAYGSIKNVMSSQSFKIKIKNAEKKYKIAYGYTKETDAIFKDGTKRDDYTKIIMLLEMDNEDVGFRNVASFEEKLNRGEEYTGLTREEMQKENNRFDTDVDGMIKLLKSSNISRSAKMEDVEAEIVKTLGRITGEEVGKKVNNKLDFLTNKRMINIGILGLQANSVGVNNVKYYGLKYLSSNLANPGNAIAELSRKIALSSNLHVSKFTKYGTILDAFGTDYSGKSREKKEEDFSKNSKQYIDNVLKEIDSGNGEYLSLSEFDAIRALKKRKTATMPEYLKAMFIVEKYDKSLFSKDKSLSIMSPEIEDIVTTLKGLNNRLKGSIIPDLENRIDDDLKAELGIDNFKGLMSVTRDMIDEETGSVTKLNYMNELLQSLALEKTINGFSPGFGKESGVHVYEAFLKTTASIGKDVPMKNDMLEILRRGINSESKDSSNSEKNVRFDTTSQVDNLLSKMGLAIETRTSDNGPEKLLELMVQTGGDRGLIRQNIEYMKKTNGVFANEDKYTQIIVDKKGAEMSLANLYEVFAKVTYDTEAKDFPEKMLLITNIIRNLSEASQLGMMIYNMGGTMKFVDIFKAKTGDGSLPKYSPKDLESMAEQRKKGIRESTGVFETAVTEMVKEISMTNGRECM